MSIQTPSPTKTKDIVLVHGLFLNWESWLPWVERFSARGFNVVAKGWPGLDGTVEELRADPTPLKGKKIADIVDYYAAIVRELDAPIVIGHSFGGLFAQLLAYRGLGSAVVAIDPCAPAGIFDLPLPTLKAGLPVLGNPLSINDATMLTHDQFRYGFTNTVPEAESRALYDRYAIPCANSVYFEGFLENFVPDSPGRIDVTAERTPVLLISGGEDHIVTPGYTKRTYDLISQSPSITALKEFPGRPHFTGGVGGWEDVADYAVAWATHPHAGILS